MFSVAMRAGGRRPTAGRSLGTLRGPAQVLGQRRTAAQPEDAGAFCAALLNARGYAQPPEVDKPTWRVALRHFAGTRPTDAEFRRLLERRATQPPVRDAGGHVAAFLLREWECFSVARLLSRRTTGSTQRRRSSPRASTLAAVIASRRGVTG